DAALVAAGWFDQPALIELNRFWMVCRMISVSNSAAEPAMTTLLVSPHQVKRTSEACPIHLPPRSVSVKKSEQKREGRAPPGRGLRRS
ncbi:hypothetical protein, partial [Nocardia sp. NPDC057272]|uniref:hypothetical protein n=1 Tax=Nocardia sp. NPDC057272 TaxID=3346079 RepID=UPI00363A480D